MNYTNCPHCGGKLRSETLGWICEKCRGFIDMQGNFHEHVEKPFMPPMTIADKIRAMSDEKLVETSLLVFCVYAEVVGIKLSPKRIAAFKQFLLKEIQKPAEED